MLALRRDDTVGQRTGRVAKQGGVSGVWDGEVAQEVLSSPTPEMRGEEA